MCSAMEIIKTITVKHVAVAVILVTLIAGSEAAQFYTMPKIHPG